MIFLVWRRRKQPRRLADDRGEASDEAALSEAGRRLRRVQHDRQRARVHAMARELCRCSGQPVPDFLKEE
jgi:hypothetical protein